MAKTLVIPSAISEVLRVQELVIADARREGFTDRAQFALRLALDEALCNAIRHGNKSDERKKVIIEYEFTPEALTISIEDEGAGFSPDKVPDPTLEENLEKLGGRGVLLMKAYMTHVEYNERGNKVTLVKGRKCKLPSA
jgi:serine/threonine-protein kinase RsbW